MKLRTDTAKFREIYDTTRVRWGLPQSVEHRRVMTHTAVAIVSGEATKRGHNPQIQGMSLECCRCSKSCTVWAPDAANGIADWTVVGPLARETCQ